MKTIRLLIIACAIFTFNQVSAQLKTPQPSPTATITQAVGLGEITVEYSRPGAKDRAIFGNLVPYDKIWRTGANASTKIELSEDVMMAGTAVPAGEYAFYAIPGMAEWTIVISKNLELWGAGGYDMKDDQARFKVKSQKMNDMVESFTIDFSNFTTDGAHLNISWEKTTVAIPVKTTAMEDIDKQITKIMAGPDAGTYYSSARHYLDNGKDMAQALTWINKAVEMRPEAFWYLHQKAKIQAESGDIKGAVATATKSLEMAKVNEEGDYGYISNNEALIKKLTEKK
ncbi:MAG: tetratricopeptide (TPR) repeat protein [Patiriisocius sp.]|jgi:tetratricopeptide (TPR) repeat protein